MSVGARSTADTSEIWESKFAALRSKYQALFEETFTLSEQLYHANKLNKKLKRENKFLIDTVTKMAMTEKREGRFRKNRNPAPEAAKALSSALTSLKTASTTSATENADSNTGTAVSEGEEGRRNGRSSLDPTPRTTTESEAYLCTAMLGPGRVCKTKRSAGSNYCWRHAPLDPNSGILFCHFEDPLTHKKCSNTVAKNKKPLLCAHHVARANLFVHRADIMNGATLEEVATLVAAKTSGAD